MKTILITFVVGLLLLLGYQTYQSAGAMGISSFTCEAVASAEESDDCVWTGFNYVNLATMRFYVLEFSRHAGALPVAVDNTLRDNVDALKRAFRSVV